MLLNPDSLDQAIAYKIHRLARLLRVHLNQMFQQDGLDIGMEQWLILVRLHENPGLSQSELADKALNDHPNITRLVDQLEKRGWVQRTADMTDRRRHLVSLTKAGHAQVEHFQPQIIAERNRIFAGFSSLEIDQLLVMLERIEQTLIIEKS
jgi:DNA-binding MarR family transcriptional regulator